MISDEKLKLNALTKQLGDIIIEKHLDVYETCVVTSSILIDSYEQLHENNPNMAHGFLIRIMDLFYHIEGNQKWR